MRDKPAPKPAAPAPQAGRSVLGVIKRLFEKAPAGEAAAPPSRSSSTRAARTASTARSVSDASMLAAQQGLTALLDRAPGSRRVVRHLAAIEHAFATRDASGLFLFDLPMARLQSALRELDTLVDEAPAPGLVTLRGRLSAALAAHETRERNAQRQQPVSSFLNDDKLQVGEANQSDFDEANAAWLKPAPGGLPPPTTKR